MSKIFYDTTKEFDEIEKRINAISLSKEEKEEVWKIIDEMVHYRVIGCILDIIPDKLHLEFLFKFHTAPYDKGHFGYLNSIAKINIKKLIKKEMARVKLEILSTIENF